MKKILSTIFAFCCFGSAFGADVTLYYSPSCPHCHHARDFINNELVYEYQTINVTALNVGAGDNATAFRAALQKCGYESGGIPVMVIGDKCFQGYADFMKSDLRNAVESDMSDAAKKSASNNIKSFESDPTAFRAANTARASVMVERVDGADQKKNDTNPMIYFYIILGVLIVGLGFVLFKKKK